MLCSRARQPFIEETSGIEFSKIRCWRRGRMPTERKIIEEQRGMFREKFARDWGPGDPVWFDPDQNEAMRKARRHRRSSTFIGKQVGCSWRGMTQDEPAVWLEGMERRDR
jgi:hypothetical protein